LLFAFFFDTFQLLTHLTRVIDDERFPISKNAELPLKKVIFIHTLCCILPFVAAPYEQIPLLAANDRGAKRQVLYMLQHVNIETALEGYQQYFSQSGTHDNPVIFSMTLFGAGLSGSAGALEILEKGLTYPDPQIQMIALHFINQINDDRTDDLLNAAMRSDFLSTRMEAAFYMSQKKHPRAVGQIEALMERLPPIFRPLFPSLFAMIGTRDATQSLQRLLDDVDPNVRVESILNIARQNRDDLLASVRKLLSRSNIDELEAAIYAIGSLKDSKSLARLKRLVRSPSDNIKIAAILALQELGERSDEGILIELAVKGNIYAIAALSHSPASADHLAKMAQSPDLQIRLNASVSLLQLKDSRCLKGIEEILISDERDLAFYLIPSVGRTIAAWKAVSSAELQNKDPALDLSLTLSLREQLLRQAIYLPSEDFLALARRLIDCRQNDLIPCLMALLEGLRTPDAIMLLKDSCKQIHAPLIRDFSHVVLFNLKEEGPYREYLQRWIMHQKNAPLIRLRPMAPWKMRMESNYTLTPDETSRLLIEAFLAFTADRNIEFLIDAILQGSPENRYALFGLLMRATE
jgi:HEAT repeat protein